MVIIAVNRPSLSLLVRSPCAITAFQWELNSQPVTPWHLVWALNQTSYVFQEAHDQALTLSKSVPLRQNI